MPSVAMTLRLPKYYADRLDSLAKVKGCTKTDLVIDGLKEIFANKLDSNESLLTKDQYESLINILNNPTPTDNQEKMNKTMNYNFPWKKKN